MVVLLPGLFAVAPIPASAQEGAVRGLAGVVVDTSGAPVPGASVRCESGAGNIVRTEAGSDGRFTCPVGLTGRLGVAASAAGFAPAYRIVVLAPGSDPGDVRLILHPGPLAETVSVTAAAGPDQLDVPASVSVVTSAQLATAPGGAVDDVLRATPGFSLFRRSTSRVANPTTQGVTLRGISASGGSRTLVLADGSPLNDPFGSWVYWNRVPRAAIDRVDVVRGAAGDIFGADALGGVIQISTFGPGRTRLRGALDAGSHATIRGSVFASRAWRSFTVAGAGEGVDTSGVRVVAPEARGPVDVAAFADYWTGFVSVARTAPAWRADVRAGIQTEDRENGTPMQRNGTDWRQVTVSAAGPAAGGLWQVRGRGGRQSYSQTFSAISAGRDAERLTTEQEIPAEFAAGSAHWARPIGHLALLVGVEGRRTSAEVREFRHSVAGAVSGPFVSGASESTWSVLARLSLAPRSSVSVNVGVRTDFWRSDPTGATGSPHEAAFTSPRLSIAWRPHAALAAHASGYRAFRTPTLNERYRGFRVGNVITNPNPLLGPERLTGGETGLLFTHRTGSVRVVGFATTLNDAITNVTLLSTPAQILRERRNTDTVRAAGVELEAVWRAHPYFSVTGLASVTASRFAEAPAMPALEGNRIPQVPRYQVGVGATWAHPRVATFVADVRALGSQFEDDQNTLTLRSSVVMDVSGSRPLSRTTFLVAAVENVLNAEYDVGRTPVRNVGWPRTFRIGLRVSLP